MRGTFTQGQVGATYTVTVSNAGTGATTGTVTVTDTLPSGLTATALSGTGWTCTLATLSCTRSNALAAGASYPAITLTVNVSSTAPASVTNTATVSGGGEVNTANNSASDVTTIGGRAGPDGDEDTCGEFHAGASRARRYTVTVTNAGTGATTGVVTVTDTLPSGLTATALSGTGWTCTLATLSCTRSTALAAGASYPAITLTVNVSSTAPASVTNTATVSGGGEVNTANNSASDVTTIGGRPGPDGDEDTCGDVHARTSRRDVHGDGEQRGHGRDDGRGDGDRYAAERTDGDGVEWHGVDVHAGDAELHAQQCAGRRGELSGADADGERVEHGACERDQHGGGERGR